MLEYLSALIEVGQFPTADVEPYVCCARKRNTMEDIHERHSKPNHQHDAGLNVFLCMFSYACKSLCKDIGGPEHKTLKPQHSKPVQGNKLLWCQGKGTDRTF